MKTRLLLIVCTFLFFFSCKKETVIVDPIPSRFFSFSYLYGEDTIRYFTIEDLGGGIGSMTFKKNTVYVLDGLVFVNCGQTLTIEPGTIIKGKTGQGENASALVVARGGKIIAEGTETDPIIFTSEYDEINRDIHGNLTGYNNLDMSVSGLWGGLIILGKATINTSPGENYIGGISTLESRAIYGGTDDLDNSGVIKYVSIRHGGTNIGGGNEISGLCLGAVGSETLIDYVEVVANGDDGIRFLGGTAQAKHMICVNAGDDSFDSDEGFRGKGQFWVSINPEDRAAEHDGAISPENAQPYTIPTIYNASYIGGRKVTFRDNSGGIYRNAIFESLSSNPTIEIEDIATGEDSKNRYENKELIIRDNVFANCQSLNTAFFIYPEIEVDSVERSSMSIVEPLSIISNSNPIPNTKIGATSVIQDTFFETAAYMGAFDEINWAKGWTLVFSTE